jgi:pilus assembly protein CpaB
MRPKSLMLLGLALGCGLVASIGISQVMDKSGQQQGSMETVPIWIALHNINLGDPIDRKMLSLEEWPKDKVPRGALSKLEEIEGRRPRSAIIEGEPVLEGKLLAVGQIADPIKSIPKGMRLKTIAVDAEKSAAGLLGPGDRVDVQLFVRKDQRTGVETAKSKVILQNIRVFAIDQAVQRSPDGSEERTIAKTISLMLLPEQASKLSLAEQIGELSLIPRNPDDQEASAWSEVTIDDLLADGEANSREKEQGRDEVETTEPTDSGLLSAIQPEAPPVKPPFRMEIVEAQDIREVLFDAETGKPIRKMVEEAAGVGPRVTPATPASYPTPSPGAASTDAEGSLGDFPIDFDAQKLPGRQERRPFLKEVQGCTSNTFLVPLARPVLFRVPLALPVSRRDSSPSPWPLSFSASSRRTIPHSVPRNSSLPR